MHFSQRIECARIFNKWTVMCFLLLVHIMPQWDALACTSIMSHCIGSAHFRSSGSYACPLGGRQDFVTGSFQPNYFGGEQNGHKSVAIFAWRVLRPVAVFPFSTRRHRLHRRAASSCIRQYYECQYTYLQTAAPPIVTHSAKLEFDFTVECKFFVSFKFRFQCSLIVV